MLIFLAIWYFLTITTYGVWVPAGLFVPGIIIGSSIGGVLQLWQMEVFGYKIEDRYLEA